MTNHHEKHILLVLGGTRSGKSYFAEERTLSIAQNRKLKPIYIATAEAFDDEMRERINRHRQERSPQFTTVEASLDLLPLLANYDENHILLIDSLGVWITNHMMQNNDVDKVISTLTNAIRTSKASLTLVSDEVGLGIIPENKMTRQFRDHIGKLNQSMANIANKAVFMVAGLPLDLKGEDTND